MADTLPNTILPPGVWVDLYAETGLPVGAQILVQNIGVCDVYVASNPTTPITDLAHQIVKRSQFSINDPGDTGAWAFCLAGGLVNVRLP